MQTAGGAVIVTKEGTRIGLAPLAPEVNLEEATPPELDPSTGISATHQVGTDDSWQAPLAAMLDELQLHRLRALLFNHESALSLHPRACMCDLAGGRTRSREIDLRLVRMPNKIRLEEEDPERGEGDARELHC